MRIWWSTHIRQCNDDPKYIFQTLYWTNRLFYSYFAEAFFRYCISYMTICGIPTISSSQNRANRVWFVLKLLLSGMYYIKNWKVDQIQSYVLSLKKSVGSCQIFFFVFQSTNQIIWLIKLNWSNQSFWRLSINDFFP